jgi:hypothetical protein
MSDAQESLQRLAGGSDEYWEEYNQRWKFIGACSGGDLDTVQTLFPRVDQRTHVQGLRYAFSRGKGTVLAYLIERKIEDPTIFNLVLDVEQVKMCHLLLEAGYRPREQDVLYFRKHWTLHPIFKLCLFYGVPYNWDAPGREIAANCCSLRLLLGKWPRDMHRVLRILFTEYLPVF